MGPESFRKVMILENYKDFLNAKDVRMIIDSAISFILTSFGWIEQNSFFSLF